MFLISRSQHALQSKHLFPCFDDGQLCCPSVVTVDVHGQKDTGPWSTIWELNLITRLRGTSFTLTRFRIWASRVGSQCLVSGVALQTLKIFCKCSSDCMSPESCHLNSLWGFINCIIASTQPGCWRASSLRSIAFLTGLNLYRPFRA